jgi:hypothetical protein
MIRVSIKQTLARRADEVTVETVLSGTPTTAEIDECRSGYEKSIIAPTIIRFIEDVIKAGYSVKTVRVNVEKTDE